NDRPRRVTPIWGFRKTDRSLSSPSNGYWGRVMGKYGRLAAGAFSVGMLIAASESSAQSLQGLGYPSDGGPGPGPGPSPKVSGVSADGRVVVGQFNGNGTARAFRWTDDTGMVRIAPLQWGAANAVNSDGRIIVGVADDGGTAEAFRW